MNELDLIKQTEIYKNCTNIVFGKGNNKSDILFVGEAPGKNEDEQGLPFVGAAGKNLNKFLSLANDITKEYVITTNLQPFLR